MKLSDGVEQAIHCVTLMAQMGAEVRVSAADLAEFHGVSPSYLLKHLQALSRAGILRTVPGPRGGYTLARPVDQITLLDIVLATEGPEPAFRCKEIRQRGPNTLPKKHFSRPCQISAAMLRAEQAYRRALRGTRVSDLIAEFTADADPEIIERCSAFFDGRIRTGKISQPKGRDHDPKT